MNKYEIEIDLEELYCKRWRECRCVCYINCEDGEIDCLKCEESIELKINK